MKFNEVLEAADNLNLEEQETLVEIIRRRMIERRRRQLADDIHDADEEFQAGKCRPMSPDELMREIVREPDRRSRP